MGIGTSEEKVIVLVDIFELAHCYSSDMSRRVANWRALSCRTGLIDLAKTPESHWDVKHSEILFLLHVQRAGSCLSSGLRLLCDPAGCAKSRQMAMDQTCLPYFLRKSLAIAPRTLQASSFPMSSIFLV